MSELEVRAAQLVGVSYPKRQIDVVVMPYETEASVWYRGRMITEIVSRGAYGTGISGRKDIRVNRDHDLTRTCGRAVKFHPSRQDGLVAELRMSRTELGEETLTLADEGLLDASAGFALLQDATGKPAKDAEVWEARDRRRLNHLFLHHVALTPEPAYETANVLAVRHNRSEGSLRADPAGRPNLERLELQRLAELAALMDARYGVGQH